MGLGWFGSASKWGAIDGHDNHWIFGYHIFGQTDTSEPQTPSCQNASWPSNDKVVDHTLTLGLPHTL